MAYIRDKVFTLLFFFVFFSYFSFFIRWDSNMPPLMAIFYNYTRGTVTFFVFFHSLFFSFTDFFMCIFIYLNTLLFPTTKLNMAGAEEEEEEEVHPHPEPRTPAGQPPPPPPSLPTTCTPPFRHLPLPAQPCGKRGPQRPSGRSNAREQPPKIRFAAPRRAPPQQSRRSSARAAPLPRPAPRRMRFAARSRRQRRRWRRLPLRPTWMQCLPLARRLAVGHGQVSKHHGTVHTAPYSLSRKPES